MRNIIFDFKFFIFFLVFKIIVSLDCTHPVYCNEEIISAAATSKFFIDTKSFLDYPLKNAPNDVVNDFAKLSDTYTFKNFFEKNFLQTKTDISKCSTGESIFKERPQFLNKIASQKYKNFGNSVYDLWEDLTFEITHTSPSDYYSSISVPNCYVAPGGRFSVQYYWDSFFIIRGLLSCSKNSLAKNMIENLLHVLQHEVSYVPNSMRWYMINRSQPPLLSQMISLYINQTKDTSIITNEVLVLLEKEYNFWMKERSVKLLNHENMEYGYLNIYTSTIKRAREDMYDVDTSNVKISKNRNLFLEFRAAAESGWDFSSRWFGVNGDISTLRVTKIIPVDLNAILYGMEMNLAKFYAQYHSVEKVYYFKMVALERLELMNEYLWNNEKKSWFDYDYENEIQLHENYYTSNIIPLYFNIEVDVHIQQKVFSYSGGTPVSLFWKNKMENEQWDFPNSWAPMTYFMLDILRKEGKKELAFNVAQKWIDSAYCAFVKTGKMYEKYNVQIVGNEGGNGEYENQIGFGWTNSITLYILELYGKKLKEIDCNFHPQKTHHIILIVFEWIMGITLVLCFVICIIGTVISLFCGWKKEIKVKKKRKIIRNISMKKKMSDEVLVMSDDQKPLLE